MPLLKDIKKMTWQMERATNFLVAAKEFIFSEESYGIESHNTIRHRSKLKQTLLGHDTNAWLIDEYFTKEILCCTIS